MLFGVDELVQRRARPLWDDDSPIRAELFSIERLEEHARSLALAQAVAMREAPSASLSKRLAANEAALLAAYRDITKAIDAGAAITPAAEWLTDNFYLVEQQIRAIRIDLPAGYYRQLPKLAGGPLAGYPRILGVAWAFIAHTDSLFDPEVLRRFLRAYQDEQPLTIGELWAVAITLRMVLVENLARIAKRVVDSRAGRRSADAWADKWVGTGELSAGLASPPVLPAKAVAFPDSFLVQLVHRLREQDPRAGPLLAWLDQQLTRQNTNADAVVRDEHQRQVAGSISVRNIITSMRLISNVDWAELFERISLVDDALNAESAFSAMDFPTRNLYRTAVEQLARGSGRTELDVASTALAAARRARADKSDIDERLTDPGYYLIAGGRPQLEAILEFRSPVRAWPGKIVRALGVGGYVAAGAFVAIALLSIPWLLSAHAGLELAALLLLGALAIVPSLDLAVALVNHVATRGFRATLLPALALRDGIPEDCRTLVVVPAMLSSPQEVEELIRNLEIHYLASPEGALQFAILSDWLDAKSETAAGDLDLLAAAQHGLARLNHLHPGEAESPRFLLLHRRRVWSESERCWIGWERKRGKLTELNKLLRGAPNTTFMSPPTLPANIRFVITLDADTRLPRETVQRLIGKMAHAINRPRIDVALGRVVEGHAVLQPRVTPALTVARKNTLFLRVFSTASGIDPYAAAISDVYQDLFGEGSYAGKGIYDVDAFEAATHGRAPESTLLSHDLFEGVFARAGLASDVEVVEQFPARYDAAAKRHHRWVRGDWQLLPWLFGAARHGVPLIGRWKMFDNLRRSLSAPMAVATLVACWLMPFPHAAIWTGFIIATIALPPLIPVAMELVSRRLGRTTQSHIRALGAELRIALLQLALMLTFLAHQAWLMGDAILRTLFRLFVTRRHLLEWAPAERASVDASRGLDAYYRDMAGALLFAGGAFLPVLLSGLNTWPLAAPFVGIWLVSPAIAAWASRSQTNRSDRPLSNAQVRSLRLIARQTWRYFETFVTPASNMLPPDNFQETPKPEIAHRTSPTNIGLYLLSVAGARDFGWIGRAEFVERLEATFTTLALLKKHRGHLYNWYDTRDLRPLDPHYVSSVDSGNLAGHLIALANTCAEVATCDTTSRRAANGVHDALAQLAEEARRQRNPRGAVGVLWLRFDAEFERLVSLLKGVCSDSDEARLRALAGQADILVEVTHEILIEEHGAVKSDLGFWSDAVRACIASHARDLAQAPLNRRLEEIADAARALAMSMEFGFLLEPDRLLLSIGYQAANGTLDPSCYDLLASEARLASFVAIAKRDIPARHWFRLGRSATPVADGAALVSWSGSMFEYLMPSLVMEAPTDSIVAQTNQLIVRRQIAFAASRGVPWGISESAYNERDLEFTYQYSNFGVPGLGLKRGLADSTVIAPYATALAAMIDPHSAVRNFEKLEAIGARGRFGFYEAVDFTPTRIPNGESAAIVRAFMAHHQGMTIVAIADALFDGIVRKRFHAEPMVQATELLLQERVPRDVMSAPPSIAGTANAAKVRDIDEPGTWRHSPHAATPEIQLLSNGRYSVALTAAGSGYSTWRGLAITRWREDATCDNWGAYLYLRDAESGECWSATLQPLGIDPDDYETLFNEDRSEFARRDGTLTTNLQVLVSAEDDAEVRRVTITNSGDMTREIEITSYAELVLAPLIADVAHPAFSKMFVETEHLVGLGALVATRRQRAPSDAPIWAAHLAVVDGEAVGQREFETDRARFLGRGGSTRAPAAIASGRPLSGTVGTVLDPVFALRRRVRIAPGAVARLDFWTMAASSRAELLDLIDNHHDAGAFHRAAALAWTQAQVQLYHLGIDRMEAAQYQRLAGHIIYAAPSLRAPRALMQTGMGAQSNLWPLGISGDLPIMLVRISELEQLGIVKQALQAAEYWRMKQLAVDLVILNERASSYVQDLNMALEGIVRASQSRPRLGEERQLGSVFILRADLIAADTKALLTSVARVILAGDRGGLADHLAGAPDINRAPTKASKRATPPSTLQVSRPAPGVEYFNGLGGFTENGREYITILGPGQRTPAPWINVIANPEFGFQLSAEGGGYTWSQNSRERQLTPWSNDPVTDRPGQVLYLKDEESGRIWTPTALPIRDEAGTYIARHGWGYSRLENTQHNIASELVEYVPLADCVKISRLQLRNLAGHTRRISVTAYVEWTLGASRAASAPFIATRLDAETGALFADNKWSAAFDQRVAFLDLAGRQSKWTGDRKEFIGRNGDIAAPASLAPGGVLSGRVGAGLDPCAALQTTITLEPGEVMEIVVLLGDAANDSAARTLIARYRACDLDAVLAEVKAFWERTVGAVQVKTPDRSMDIMLNGWLTYQTLACRIWARSGFYQASGAYGFRDQLQDGMALAATHPAITREHLLRAARRQFVEGDVQHWWLPHSGQGVRTRISDDRAWLAYATAHYVKVSGDAAVLDEITSFIEGPPLEPEEADAFFTPTVSEQAASLYDHCARALDASLAVGRHGAPLIGGGDWNDGMNRVGICGEGESVWLGWLLCATLDSFAVLAEARGDSLRAKSWRASAASLKLDLNANAWDGHWYRRGWFDDGAALGAADNEECRIDSIAQSWAVLSGAAPRERAAEAMAAVERELIVPHEGLVLLFAPPFDRSSLDPGYIKGYPPGLRENGGQYTHAALWSVMAFAALGEGDKAAALFWMLNPINHARTRSDMHRYKVEPYVVAADVYAAPGHVGRGGWTWYTGSAAWMQRAGIESILGLSIEGNELRLDPCVPKSWPHFEINFRQSGAHYDIRVENPSGVQRGIASAELDGVAISIVPLVVPMTRDGVVRNLKVVMG